MLAGLQFNRGGGGHILRSDQARIRLDFNRIVHYLDILRHALQCGSLQSIRHLFRLEQFLIVFPFRILLHAVVCVLLVAEHGHVVQVVAGEHGVVGFCQVNGPLIAICRVIELLQIGGRRLRVHGHVPTIVDLRIDIDVVFLVHEADLGNLIHTDRPSIHRNGLIIHSM